MRHGSGGWRPLQALLWSLRLRNGLRRGDATRRTPDSGSEQEVAPGAAHGERRGATSCSDPEVRFLLSRMKEGACIAIPVDAPPAARPVIAVFATLARRGRAVRRAFVAPRRQLRLNWLTACSPNAPPCPPSCPP